MRYTERRKEVVRGKEKGIRNKREKKYDEMGGEKRKEEGWIGEDKRLKKRKGRKRKDEEKGKQRKERRGYRRDEIE